jgi:hypothetical protein
MLSLEDQALGPMTHELHGKAYVAGTTWVVRVGATNADVEIFFAADTSISRSSRAA